MEKSNEQIFDENARRNMLNWNLADFKTTHPKLFTSVLVSMDEAVCIHKNKLTLLGQKLENRTVALGASIERNIKHKEDVEKLVEFVLKLKKNLSNAGRLAPYESDEIAAIIGKHL